jgi:[acyl-carrier-protein] S-malonyltransferase
MKPADERLAEALAEAQLRGPRIPVYSNVDASPHTDSAQSIAATLATQVTQSVRWEDSMRRMIADGFDTFYEIGPGRVLTGLLKRIDRKTPCTSIAAR